MGDMKKIIGVLVFLIVISGAYAFSVKRQFDQEVKLNDELQQDYDALEEKYSDLKEKYIEMDSKKSDLLTLNSTNNNRISKLNTEISNLKSDNENVKAENSEVQVEVGESLTDIDELQSSLDDIEADYAKYIDPAGNPHVIASDYVYSWLTGDFDRLEEITAPDLYESVVSNLEDLMAISGASVLDFKELYDWQKVNLKIASSTTQKTSTTFREVKVVTEPYTTSGLVYSSGDYFTYKVYLGIIDGEWKVIDAK